MSEKTFRDIFKLLLENEARVRGIPNNFPDLDARFKYFQETLEYRKLLQWNQVELDYLLSKRGEILELHHKCIDACIGQNFPIFWMRRNSKPVPVGRGEREGGRHDDVVSWLTDNQDRAVWCSPKPTARGGQSITYQAALADGHSEPEGVALQQFVIDWLKKGKPFVESVIRALAQFLHLVTVLRHVGRLEGSTSLCGVCADIFVPSVLTLWIPGANLYHWLHDYQKETVRRYIEYLDKNPTLCLIKDPHDPKGQDKAGLVHAVVQDLLVEKHIPNTDSVYNLIDVGSKSRIASIQNYKSRNDSIVMDYNKQRSQNNQMIKVAKLPQLGSNQQNRIEFKKKPVSKFGKFFCCGSKAIINTVHSPMLNEKKSAVLQNKNKDDGILDSAKLSFPLFTQNNNKMNPEHNRESSDFDAEHHNNSNVDLLSPNLVGVSISEPVFKSTSPMAPFTNFPVMFSFADPRDHNKLLVDWSDIKQRIEVAKSIAKAVLELHQKKIGHFDIALKNVMFDVATKKAILIDFGSICSLDEDGVAYDLHANFAYSRPYLHPSRRRGQNWSVRDDAHALLLVVAEVLGSTPAEVWKRLSDKSETPFPVDVEASGLAQWLRNSLLARLEDPRKPTVASIVRRLETVNI